MESGIDTSRFGTHTPTGGIPLKISRLYTGHAAQSHFK